MSILEINGGILILITCILCIILCLMQDQKQQNMSSALTGASNDSFYKHNEGRTKEAILNKVTRTLAIIFFIATLAVNIIPIFVK